MPCDLERLMDVAREYSIPVIEDAACAIGSEICWKGEWERIGKPHGDAACFSFHPRKVISTGDGGMITTRNPEWDARFRLLRQHCMSIPDTTRHGSSRVMCESYPETGFNYRMTDVQAAIGREQLKRLSEVVRRRRDLAETYRSLLSGIPEVELPQEPEWARSNWQSYCIGLPPGVDQREVMQMLLDAGISTRRGIMCAHREPAYQGNGTGGDHYAPLTLSERAQDRTILIPLFHQLTREDQVRIASMLEAATSAVCVA
jgi:dTDP-4-amino-4,6-dideoxygalactose transaminase